MTIADLNGADRDTFVEAVGWVFEHSPWVAERVWAQRPFDSVDALHRAMVSEVRSATAEEQLKLLGAHPDLGARVKMSAASVGEQTGAGLDRLSTAEVARLTALTTTYREKFGFPFVYAVKGRTKEDVLNALENRLPSLRNTELGEALQQVYRIARFRLEEAMRAERS